MTNTAKVNTPAKYLRQIIRTGPLRKGAALIIQFLSNAEPRAAGSSA
jgi:hypothetical protein